MSKAYSQPVQGTGNPVTSTASNVPSLYTRHQRYIEAGTADNTRRAYRSAVRHCPVTALQDWLAVSEIEDGPVFRSVDRWGKLGTKALTPAAVGDVQRKTAAKAGLAFVASPR